MKLFQQNEDSTKRRIKTSLEEFGSCKSPNKELPFQQNTLENILLLFLARMKQQGQKEKKATRKA